MITYEGLRSVSRGNYDRRKHLVLNEINEYAAICSEYVSHKGYLTNGKSKFVQSITYASASI